MLGAALAPVPRLYLADGSEVRVLARREAVACAGSAAIAFLRAVRLRSDELRRLRAVSAPTSAASDEAEDTVLVIWRGAPENLVGGSVTHIAGVLGGFRRCGLRVALVTSVEPPLQLLAHIDELTVAPPSPESWRLTRDVEGIAANRALTTSAIAMGRRSRPRFIYQRHDAFITAGADVARFLGRPLVLEWNGSEVWTRANWLQSRSFHGWFDPLVRLAEVGSIAAADVVAAVSVVAAEVAVEAGATREHVLVSPNAVDIDEIDAITLPLSRSGNDSRLVGWIGTFGPWHGAEVLIRALAQLPDDVSVVMIGDGARRPACQELAASLGVRARVEFTGTLPHDVALRRLRTCAVLASPHTPLEGREFFGSPTKLFEYMALGRPIVASALGQIGEILADDESAVLVRPGDVDDFARGLRLALADPRRAEALAQNARAAVAAAHTWEHRARAIVEAVSRRSANRGRSLETAA
jgi:glycosyltransferase involved in cell wall biosynthesis